MSPKAKDDARPMIPLRADNPVHNPPLVTWALLGACVLVFLWQMSLGPREGQVAIYALGVTPAVLFGAAVLPAEAQWVPVPLTILTSMFLHGGLLHLFGNMLYLWIFAGNIEEYLGRAGFLVFYAVCGIAAALAQAVPEPQSAVPMIGASGAISGVLGAYLLLFPRTRVLVLIPLPFLIQLVRLPAAVVLALWFLVQLLSSLLAPAEAGVAFRAHLGGFVAGALLIPFWAGARRRR